MDDRAGRTGLIFDTADWLGQIIGYDPKNHDSYTVGQAHFTEKTGLDLDSNLDGASNGR